MTTARERDDSNDSEEGRETERAPTNSAEVNSSTPGGAPIGTPVPTPFGTPLVAVANQPGGSSTKPGLSTERAPSGFAEVTARGAVKEPDHASAAKIKEGAERAAEEEKAQRAEVRKASPGNLPGKWLSVGGTLVNVENASAIQLPTDGEENPALTITLASGKTVAATGEEVGEIMEDMGWKALPASAQSNRATVEENGRLITPKDREAEANPERLRTVPDRSHRSLPPNPEVPKSATNEATAPASNAKTPEGEEDAGEFHATEAETEADDTAKGARKTRAKATKKKTR